MNPSHDNTKHTMQVFYRPEQVARNVSAYSPSAYKPKQVIEDWLARGIIRPEDIHSFEPVSCADIKRVHAPQMVDDVLDLKRRNGFRNHDPEVTASLPYTCGSLLAAARWALAHQETVCSPTSGFHHAGFDEPSGYCTFNGLMVTAAKLLDEGAVQRIAILDCDMHYGRLGALSVPTRCKSVIESSSAPSRGVRWCGTWRAATSAMQQGASNPFCNYTATPPSPVGR